MSPTECGIITEANRPKNMGGLHEDDFYDLEERRAKMIADGVKML